MGSSSREKPRLLAAKLLEIRVRLGLSQNEMVSRLGLEDKLIRSDISKYERGVREPSLLVVLKYAKAIGVSTDALIDDEENLPPR